MAIDREATLKNAEKFLRVGRLDAAITEYARVVDDQPRDWTTANTLGDLYMRAKQPDRAVALYSRIADHLRMEGFYPKAAALYKKILKITPDDETVQLHLAEISVRQGLLADAKSYFAAVAGRPGRIEPARALLAEALASGGSSRDAVIALAWSLAGSNVEAATLCVEAVADASIASGDFADAAAILQELESRVPGQIGTLLRLVEVSVDGGLEATMYAAQAQLADAYLAADRAEEARVIAEDLVTRAPDEPSHIERLRTALTMLNVDDVEGAIMARTMAVSQDGDAFDDFDDIPVEMKLEPPRFERPEDVATVPTTPPAEPASVAALPTEPSERYRQPLHRSRKSI